ncbi:toxin secretion/phage lysis holin [Terrisporobacter glycolicus]|nr:toxin secretion/phage lysis holin [Terrisporobacter glycolicus]
MQKTKGENEMEKYFNEISVGFGLIGGFMCKFLGGWDMLLKAIVILVVLDYVTGLLKAIYNKSLSSEIGFKGLIRKIIIFVVIATAYVIQGIVGDAIPLREITILFFIANESLSLLENAGEFVPIPDKLKDTLIQLRDNKEVK